MSYLKFPPIKQKIPSVLFYNQKNTQNYFAISPNKGVVGNFSLNKRNEMFITHLFVSPEERGKKIGTKILNFVEQLSKKEGLEGKIRVLASILDKKSMKPPHIFYRKYGFTSDDKIALSQIDKYIANNQPLPQLFKPIYMYYVPKK